MIRSFFAHLFNFLLNWFCFLEFISTSHLRWYLLPKCSLDHIYYWRHGKWRSPSSGSGQDDLGLVHAIWPSFTIYSSMQLRLVSEERTGWTVRFLKEKVFQPKSASTNLQSFRLKPNHYWYMYFLSICWNRCFNIFTLHHSICELGHRMQGENLFFQHDSGEPASPEWVV